MQLLIKKVIRLWLKKYFFPFFKNLLLLKWNVSVGQNVIINSAANLFFKGIKLKCVHIFLYEHWTCPVVSGCKLAHTSTYVLLEIRWAATVNIKCILVHWQELEGKLFCKFKILVMQLWKNVLGQLTSFYLLPLGNLSVSVWMNWRSNCASNCIKMAKKDRLFQTQNEAEMDQSYCFCQQSLTQ